ncbi:MAG: aldo/keto reductase [Acidobacteriaceae bacterium]|nr:aldo/keto reductase [Acidobacteriaceae bacterium]MBV8572465.1 aldo/keto reductase [Acidobacteriaceae bacterium]
MANERDIPYRTLGHTGEQVSCIGMGGYHLGKPNLTEAEAIKLIHAGIERGINFLDNSWDYNEGESERRMGKALRQNNSRERVFLMTKIDGRTKESAAKQIDESLQRLETEYVDLVQFHEIIRFEDPDRIFSPAGAIEAAIDAKQRGKVRYIGFTGHKDPHVHLYMLEVADEHGFTFDSVQMPINVMDAHFRSFGNMVVPELQKRNIGVLAMKSMGDTTILKSNVVSALECLQYALNMPTSVVITGIDKPEILEQAIHAAKTYQEVTREQIAAILSKTRDAARSGQWELFKTSSIFDSTAQHLDWLGEVSPHVKAISPV